jgi:hypothetical protein
MGLDVSGAGGFESRSAQGWRGEAEANLVGGTRILAPMEVGTGPPASWSRKKQQPSNAAKLGHYFPILVSQVHRISPANYSLVTVPLAQHAYNHGWLCIRNEDGRGVNYILHEVRFAGRSPPGWNFEEGQVFLLRLLHRQPHPFKILNWRCSE